MCIFVYFYCICVYLDMYLFLYQEAKLLYSFNTQLMFSFQSMFDATLREREASFKLAPSTSMFIHWLVGMVYVFYFASFILLLREVLRPGVLWFLRNINDPDFNPIQEVRLHNTSIVSIHVKMLMHLST